MLLEKNSLWFYIFNIPTLFEVKMGCTYHVYLYNLHVYIFKPPLLMKTFSSSNIRT